jgi:uncharacterized protein (UPF0264 family)
MTDGKQVGPGLLVSVRSVPEALAALAGGADLIDVKEPDRGPLGAADRQVAEDVIAAVGAHVPVSVALGEWVAYSGGPPPRGAAFAKWGLCGATASAARHIRTAGGAAAVLVAYADHGRAASPPVEQLARAACELRFPAFLIDTAVKDGSTLRDWVPPDALARVRFRLAAFGVRLALAGSLDEDTVGALLPLAPDWFAVRGAACNGGRSGSVSADRVRQLRRVIEAARTPGAGG